MLIRILILSFVFFSQQGLAEIYKWSDKKGDVHFGDSPPEKQQVEKVNVEINSYEHATYEHVDFYKGENSNRVTMYSTSWCGYCKKARAYFRDHKISYIDYDIEKDERAKRMYDLLGATGVPVILVGKTKMQGFSASKFERIYK